MQNVNGAVELHNEGDVQASIERCQAFVARICLNVLCDCATEGRDISKEVMLDSMYSAFLAWATSKNAEPILGMSSQVASLFLAAHGSQFRARFQPAVDHAFEAWSRANAVNGTIVN